MAVKKIGLSLSYCVKDIINGVYGVEDIDKIITGTMAKDRAGWDKLMFRYCKAHWQANTREASEICMELLLLGKIDQPRTRGEYPPCVANGHWIDAESDQAKILKIKEILNDPKN